MKTVLNLLPLLFLIAAAYTGYSFYTSQEGLLKFIPLTIALISAFIVSLAWRISPQGASKTISGICFIAVLITGIYFCMDPAAARSIWIPFCILILISVHAALFSIAASSFLFTEGRVIILLLPIVISAIGIGGLFLWNGSLVLSGIGLIASVIFALLSALFGMPKKKTFAPEDN